MNDLMTLSGLLVAPMYLKNGFFGFSVRLTIFTVGGLWVAFVIKMGFIMGF